MNVFPKNLYSESLLEPGSLVWCYLRYSTDDQNLDSQEQVIREWCKEYRLNLGPLFKDEARSGKTTAGRQQFLHMIELLEKATGVERPAGIVFWNFARFSRDYDDSQYFKAHLRRLGYKLQSLIDKIPSGLEGRVLESIKDYSNALEARTRSLEAKRGLHALAAQGYSTGGFPPRGYKRSAPISLGRKLNGEERFAYRWEIDPEWETRVRQALQMRLAGKDYWEIHRATRLFKGIQSYSSFFANQTYAGYRKCGDLAVPNAHPAYISKEEFDHLQQLCRPGSRNIKMPNGDANSPRRRQSPFLLSGLLFCQCGAAMVGDRDRGKPFYRCGRQQREGREICAQPTIVAWYIHKFVVGWMADHVLTPERMMNARDAINCRLSGNHEELLMRKSKLEQDQRRVDRSAHNLVEALKLGVLEEKIKAELKACELEAHQIEAELVQVHQMLTQQEVRITDEALQLLAGEMRDQLLGGDLEESRAVLREALVRAELGNGKMTVYFAPPAVDFDKTWVRGVPPREWLDNPSLRIPIEKVILDFPQPKRGAGSPLWAVGL